VLQTKLTAHQFGAHSYIFILQLYNIVLQALMMMTLVKPCGWRDNITDSLHNAHVEIKQQSVNMCENITA